MTMDLHMSPLTKHGRVISFKGCRLITIRVSGSSITVDGTRPMVDGGIGVAARGTTPVKKKVLMRDGDAGIRLLVNGSLLDRCDNVTEYG